MHMRECCGDVLDSMKGPNYEVIAYRFFLRFIYVIIKYKFNDMNLLLFLLKLDHIGRLYDFFGGHDKGK